MSDFSEMMEDGFAEAEAVLRPASGPVNISTGSGGSAVTRACIFSNVDTIRVLRETGLKPTYTAIAELPLADAQALGLYPMETSGGRPLCAVAGRTWKRDGLDEDPHDPTVRLHLIPHRA